MPPSETLADQTPSMFSYVMSFSSPESDFCMGANMPAVERTAEHIEAEAMVDATYSYSHPEADFLSMESVEVHPAEVQYPATLSFSSPESDFTGSVATSYGAMDIATSDTFKKISYNDAITSASTEPLVITEPSPPFKIVHANAAWNEVYESNKGVLGHSLALANLKALGKKDVLTMPTGDGCHLKVVQLDNKYLMSTLDGYKKVQQGAEQK